VSAQAAAIIGAILGTMVSAICFLAYSLSRTRERIARIETLLELEHLELGPRRKERE
jgi:hypothetical protein